jgi:hypothetical protein
MENLSIDQTTYAYLAGVIDIHGFIAINRSKDGYVTRMGFSDSSPLLPNLALAVLSGRVSEARPRKPTYQTFYIWEVERRMAREPLLLLKPYLRLKQRHADIALEMIDLHGVPRPISEGNRLARARLFEELEVLNRDRRRRKRPITA